MEPICRLPASGFTETPESVLVWADQVVSIARSNLTGVEPLVGLWAYRHGGFECLAADISDENDTSMGHSLTFLVGGDMDLDIHEPSVPDMADALHLIGIVIEALQARVVVGLRSNEVNEMVLAHPLAPGETNGAIRRAG
ncbi:hypothetical protein ACV22V_31380 [Burkholderia sp. AW33-5]